MTAPFSNVYPFSAVSKASTRDAASGGMAVAMALQRSVMHAVSGDSETFALASDAFRSFVRAYATHPKVLAPRIPAE